MNLGDAPLVNAPAGAPGYAPAPQAEIAAAIAAEEAPTPEEKAVSNPVTNVLSALLAGRRLQQTDFEQLDKAPLSVKDAAARGKLGHLPVPAGGSADLQPSRCCTCSIRSFSLPGACALTARFFGQCDASWITPARIARPARSALRAHSGPRRHAFRSGLPCKSSELYAQLNVP